MNKSKNKQKGYALLFVIIVISIISALTAGLANTTLKQSILSSTAKDSQAAFFASDTATECALYAHYNYTEEIEPLSPNHLWQCGGINLYYKPGPSGSYVLDYANQNNTGFVKTKPCFRIESSTQKLGVEDITTIISRGMNYCDIENPRIVERAIKATIKTIPE